MTFLDTQLNLVNRTLRHRGYREAFDHEEATVAALAAQGLAIDWIAAQIRASRTAAAYDASTPSGISWKGSIER